MTSITQEVCKEAGVKPRDAERSKNFFALGLVSWLYTRPTEPTIEWIAKRFAERPQVAEANTRAFRAGLPLRRDGRAVHLELRGAGRPTSSRASTPTSPGTRRWRGACSPPPGWPGCRSSSGSYPITPASDILHELSRRKEFGVRTFQAEDEIAGVGAALGAAFGGSLGVTTTSGPGPRPQVRDDRAGGQPRAAADRRRHPARRPLDRPARPRPSRPTCCTPCTAATARPRCRSSRPGRPSHCFDAAIEAVRIAVTYRTPVILLSDGYLANGSEPWRLPDVAAMPRIEPGVRQRAQPHWPRTGRLPSGPTCATPRRWPGHGPLRASRASSTASAASRRPTAPATSPTTPRTTSGWSSWRAAKIAGIAEGHPRRARSTTRTGGRAARPRLGFDLRGDHRGRPPGPGPGPQGRPGPPRLTSTRSRSTWARCSAATRRCSCPR